MAYYLAAWPMGVVVFVVGFPATPFLPISAEFFSPDRLPSWERFFPALVIMCLAWMITAAILRTWIRKPEHSEIVVAGIISVYTATVTFIVLGSFCGTIATFASPEVHLFGTIALSELVIGVLFTAAWATVLMPVAGPIGVCCCAILRCVDQYKTEMDPICRSVLGLVERWKIDCHGRLEATPVAQWLGIDRQTAAEHLKTLCRLGILDKTGPDSYCRRGDA